MVIAAKPWTGIASPRRVLAIRLQAMGDVVITLPYLNALRQLLPEHTRFDFLTRKETEDIPRSLELFSNVYAIGGGRNPRLQWASALAMLPTLAWNRYDCILDLQNNRISRFVRQSLSPAAWTAFERFAPVAAGERTMATIDALGLGKVGCRFVHCHKDNPTLTARLRDAGWREGRELVVLNPAGAFANRNWPLESYASFARLWQSRFPDACFVVAGIGSKMADKARQLKAWLGEALIDLVDKTSPADALLVVQKAQLVLSEDSGLMHMAWVAGVPTIALFGSSRSDWSRPLGAHTAFFDSSDLECGACLSEQCRHQGEKTNWCMTRISPAEVFDKALSLIAGSGTNGLIAKQA